VAELVDDRAARALVLVRRTDRSTRRLPLDPGDLEHGAGQAAGTAAPDREALGRARGPLVDGHLPGAVGRRLAARGLGDVAGAEPVGQLEEHDLAAARHAAEGRLDRGEGVDDRLVGGRGRTGVPGLPARNADAARRRAGDRRQALLLLGLRARADHRDAVALGHDPLEP
jgi:hypothetical protein